MKKTIITISILILIAFVFIGYKTDMFGLITKDNSDYSLIVKDYLGKMIDHEQLAVMASTPIMNNLDIKEARVRVMAANTVDVHSFDIAKMNNIYSQYLGGAYMISTSTENIFSNLAELKGDELGKMYIKDLIKHNERSIKISETFIKKIEKYKNANAVKQDGIVITSSHPAIDESYDLAKSIIDSKKKEIELMKNIY